MNTHGLASRIEQLRRDLGPRLAVVAHHYQHDDVIRHADLRGDSLELARKVADITAENIVFCGVFFMAETAALLAKPGQKVYLSEMAADCAMARMVPAKHLAAALESLNAGGRKVVPLTYVNSSLAVKAVTGQYGGAVCTSANARRMLEWALEQGDAVLFLPDKYLGANMANLLGIPEGDRHTLSLDALGVLQSPRSALNARMLLWPGWCPVHEEFTTAHLEEMRKAHPGALAVVHPECPPAVVDAADASGSTTFIIRYVADAPAGSTVIVGTEINLVNRLAREHAGRVTVLPLTTSACPDMGFTTGQTLLTLLEDIAKGQSRNIVTVPPDLAPPAKAALDRMLRMG